MLDSKDATFRFNSRTPDQHNQQNLIPDTRVLLLFMVAPNKYAHTCTAQDTE